MSILEFYNQEEYFLFFKFLEARVHLLHIHVPLESVQQILIMWQMFSRWLSIDWNEPLKSTVAMLTTETYIIPKLENRVHLGMLVSASFVP